jgi:hypothetical protein
MKILKHIGTIIYYYLFKYLLSYDAGKANAIVASNEAKTGEHQEDLEFTV